MIKDLVLMHFLVNYLKLTITYTDSVTHIIYSMALNTLAT